MQQCLLQLDVDNAVTVASLQYMIKLHYSTFESAESTSVLLHLGGQQGHQGGEVWQRWANKDLKPWQMKNVPEKGVFIDLLW